MRGGICPCADGGGFPLSRCPAKVSCDTSPPPTFALGTPLPNAHPQTNYPLISLSRSLALTLSPPSRSHPPPLLTRPCFCGSLPVCVPARFAQGRFGNEKFKVGEDDEGYKVMIKLKYYLRYLDDDTEGAGRDDSPLYAFDSSFGDHAVKKYDGSGLKPPVADASGCLQSDTWCTRGTVPAPPPTEPTNPPPCHRRPGPCGYRHPREHTSKTRRGDI